MKNSRRIVKWIAAVGGVVVAACIALTAIGFSKAKELDRAATRDRAAARWVASAVATAEPKIKQLATENRSLRAGIASTTLRLRALSAQRAAIWKRYHEAAAAQERPGAYESAYQEAFPVALDSSTDWYIVRVTRSDGYRTVATPITAGREYVVDGGDITAYAPGNAPNPYLYDMPDLSGGGYDSASDGCPSGWYVNVDNICIPGPTDDPTLPVPGGPTAICADGSYSYSQHRSGTCSHHGGVASWGG